MKHGNRLTQSSDFKRVRCLGKNYAHPLVMLQIAQREDDLLKIGIVTNKRLGNAVIRNRAKRRIKACIMEMIPLMKKGWDVILIARIPLINASFDEIRNGIKCLLEKSDLIEYQRVNHEDRGCLS